MSHVFVCGNFEPKLDVYHDAPLHGVEVMSSGSGTNCSPLGVAMWMEPLGGLGQVGKGYVCVVPVHGLGTLAAIVTRQAAM